MCIALLLFWLSLGWSVFMTIGVALMEGYKQRQIDDMKETAEALGYATCRTWQGSSKLDLSTFRWKTQ